MVDIDGTGDGDGGKDIWVMGTPTDGCGCREPGAGRWVGWAGGADAVDDAGGTSKGIGAEAGSEGMPP